MFYSGNYFAATAYQVQGDTVVVADTVWQNSSTVATTINNLPANTLVKAWRLLWKLGDTTFNRTDTVAFRTKQAPQQTGLTWLYTHTGIVADTVWFHFSSISHATPVYFSYGNFAYTSDTVYVTGIGDTFVLVTNPNSPGATYSNNALIAGANPALGINQVFVLVSPFTVPGLSVPNVSELQLVTKGQDSIQWQASASKGNVPVATVSAISRDSLGHSIILAHFTIAGDTLFTITQRNLLPNTWHTLRLIMTDAGGIDSDQVSAVKTKSVLSSTITNWTEHDSTTSSTYILVTANSNGSFSDNRTSVSMGYYDKNGAHHTLLGTVNALGVINYDFLLTNLSPGPASNTATIYAQNSAGTDSATITFVIETPPPPRVENAPIVTHDSLESVTSTILHGSISYTVKPGDTVDVMSYAVNQSNSDIDSMPVALHVTQSGHAPFTYYNRQGGVYYCVTAITRSADNIASPVSASECVKMIDAGLPMLYNIFDSITEDNQLLLVIRGNGNGGLSGSVTSSIFQASNDSLLTTTPSTPAASGDLYLPIWFSGLKPGTLYTVGSTFVTDKGVTTITKQFWTSGTTAIKPIVNLPANQFVKAYDLAGHEIGNPCEFWKKHDELQFEPAGIYLIEPVELDGEKSHNFASFKIPIVH